MNSKGQGSIIHMHTQQTSLPLPPAQLQYAFNTICFLHSHTIVAAISFMFLQPLPGNIVDENEVGIILPIMVDIVPSDASLPFDVVVSFSVTGGTATSKDSSTYT